MHTFAPIVLFVYNRPEHTRRTIEFLQKNGLAAKSDLFIFSDGPKNEEGKASVEEVRKIISETTGFLSLKIQEQPKNMGLARSVIAGVSQVLEQYEKVIVLEDDLIITPDFLDFMNEALNQYQEENKVFSVTGYSYPLADLKNYPYSAYFSHRGSSWSWGTWRDRWQAIDWEIKDRNHFIHNKKQQQAFNETCGPDVSNMLIKQLNGKIDSWAIRFTYNAYTQNKLHVLAAKNKVKNIGHDNTGTHSPKTTKYDVPLIPENTYNFPPEVRVEPNLKKAVLKFLTKNFMIRLIRRIIPVKE